MRCAVCCSALIAAVVIGHFPSSVSTRKCCQAVIDRRSTRGTKHTNNAILRKRKKRRRKRVKNHKKSYKLKQSKIKRTYLQRRHVIAFCPAYVALSLMPPAPRRLKIATEKESIPSQLAHPRPLCADATERELHLNY
jgi:hypothetical protein